MRFNFSTMMIVSVNFDMILFLIGQIAVPPNIDDSLSSSDVIVREGSNVTLRCKATGR